MRQLTGTMLLLSSAVAITIPWANAEGKRIQLSETEQQEIREANQKLFGLTLSFFLHGSWPLSVISPGNEQKNFFSILQSHQMMEKFCQTGDFTLQTPNLSTPLHVCVAMGLNHLAIRLIEAGAPVNTQTIFIHDGVKEPGDTPLTWVCVSDLYSNSTAEDRLSLVLSLLQHGADPDHPGPRGLTPFMISSLLSDNNPEQEKIALALLDAGSPDLKQRLNATARATGFSSLSVTICNRLIKAGFDVNERFFESKQTPLHIICSKEQPPERLIPLIEQLIQAGADPNLPDVDGLTPLMVCNTPEIAIYLINHGANPSHRNNDGQTAYDFHMRNGYPTIAEAIKKHCPNKKTSTK